MTNFLASLFRRPAPAPVVTGPITCNEHFHVAQSCTCYVDLSIPHDASLNWRDCSCAACDGFRRLRMHRTAELMEERMYVSHCARQEKRRRLMESVDPTAWSEEMARPTVVSDELGVRTIVSLEVAV